MTLIVAHRGASRDEPENTVRAFERAVEVGADGIELDVRRSADDQLVVHHDPFLGDGRPIRSTSRSGLPPDVPSLADALDACAGAFVNIEIKNDPDEPDFDPSEWVAHRVAVELAHRGIGPHWLVSSFRFETIEVCRALLPGVRTAWLVEEPEGDCFERCARSGHVAVHPRVDTLDRATLRRAHALGLAVNVWTCDDPTRLRELIGWGVDGICTNVPDVGIAVRSGTA